MVERKIGPLTDLGRISRDPNSEHVLPGPVPLSMFGRLTVPNQARCAAAKLAPQAMKTIKTEPPQNL